MADIVYMAKTVWQDLLTSIKTKAGYVGTLTASQAKAAVDSIQTGGGSAPDHYISFEYNSNNQPISAVVHGIPSIQQSQFRNENMLTSISIDSTTKRVGNDAFNGCRILPTLKIPGVINDIGSGAFRGCWAITEIDLNPHTYATIPANAFNANTAMSTLIIRRTDGVCPVSASSAFTGTPLESGTGTVYVPQDLISAYQTAANWSALYAAGTRFVAIEGSIYE